MANIAAASEQTVDIVEDSEGTYDGVFYSKKHYDVWEED